MNLFVSLHDKAGVRTTEDKGVENVVVDYFDDLFCSTSPTDFETFLEKGPLSITPEMNRSLIRNTTEEEVRKTLFIMHQEKAPGRDGMKVLFFQHS